MKIQHKVFLGNTISAPYKRIKPFLDAHSDVNLLESPLEQKLLGFIGKKRMSSRQINFCIFINENLYIFKIYLNTNGGCQNGIVEFNFNNRDKKTAENKKKLCFGRTK